MSNPPKHWKEQYEDAASEEKKRLSNMDVEKLLQNVRQGQYGDYHQIWYALAEKATLEQVGWTLYNILSSNIDYLHRYHAAAALLKLLEKSGERTDLQPVQLSGSPIFIRDNLPKVRDILVQKLGTPAPLHPHPLPRLPHPLKSGTRRFFLENKPFITPPNALPPAP
jgi:hypothetical protein